MPMSNVEILRAACCVAGVDGDISPKERGLINTLVERAGVGSASVGAMIDMAKADPEYYKRQLHMLTSDPDLALKTMFVVAMADGKLTDDERVALRHFASRLEISDERFARLLQAAEKQTGMEA